MAYQVLARKWRPTTFDTLVGQEHVLQALRHALDAERLHHAYLFTGTRGVGKTTIARILARCLNCEEGVSATPCGVCSSCREIGEGRSVDLIEVDAASRTKVEDTRELLDNVQYAPTRSRFKIYLIDEVHMLSGHSFNALLKTLEEPPEHVKFLFATTDPQKLPATVLSRCLQFNLKNLSAERVVGHLREILGAEQIDFEDPALWLLGRAAAGSMRDALSLTDQAIAFGSGSLLEGDVADMLGTVDRSHVFDLLAALLADDAGALLEACAAMDAQGVAFVAALDELCSVLHRVAIAQAVPGAISQEFGDAERIAELASRCSAEDVQLFFQLAGASRRRVAEAADARAEFEMMALRLLAFRPVEVLDPSLRAADLVPVERAGEVGDGVKKSEPPPAASVTGTAASAAPRDGPEPLPVPTTAALPERRKRVSPEPGSQAGPAPEHESQPAAVRESETGAAGAHGMASGAARKAREAHCDAPMPWHEVLETLGLSGSAYNVASNCELRERGDALWQLLLDESQSNLFNVRHSDLLAQSLSRVLGRELQVHIEIGVVESETPARRRQRLLLERRRDARAAIDGDPWVQRLKEEFAATVVDSSLLLHEPENDSEKR